MKTKKLFALFALPLLAAFSAAPAFAETWKNVALVDTMCSSKVKDNPDAHTTKCAITCQKSGFGIFTSDGKYLKFDEAGNKKALELLKSTSKADHVRVNVTGEQSGDQIAVKSVTL